MIKITRTILASITVWLTRVSAIKRVVYSFLLGGVTPRATAKSYIWLFLSFFYGGEVSPYAATPRCAWVCVYPLRGDTPRRPVRFLAKQGFAAAPPVFLRTLGFCFNGVCRLCKLRLSSEHKVLLSDLNLSDLNQDSYPSLLFCTAMISM